MNSLFLCHINFSIAVFGLKVFKKVFKEYVNNDLIGAVAYISVELEADKFAIKNGLFVIKATGESARITNKKDFQPKIW